MQISRKGISLIFKQKRDSNFESLFYGSPQRRVHRTTSALLSQLVDYFQKEGFEFRRAV